MATNDYWWNNSIHKGEQFPYRLDHQKVNACSMGATSKTVEIRETTPWFPPVATTILSVLTVFTFANLIYSVIKHQELCKTQALGASNVNIAKVTAPYNATCSASSNWQDKKVLHGCKKVMDGYDCDADHCNWIAKSGANDGSWIQINFPLSWDVVSIDFHRRNSAVSQCSVYTLLFSTGQTQDVTVPNPCVASPAWDYVQLTTPISSTYVRITCKTICKNVNGAGFQEIRIWAVPPSC